MASSDSNARVVGFIDMDAFYIAVEMQGPFKAQLHGKPAAVVQYNSGERNTADCGAEDLKRFDVKDGTIIAVNYPARACGVKRNMRGREAHKACPELVLVRVPTKHGKADLTIYKEAGNNVVNILKRRAAACEKRSVDEVAIDITPESDRLLASVQFLELAQRAREASYLADSAASTSAAAVSKEATRKGHAGQLVEATRRTMPLLLLPTLQPFPPPPPLAEQQVILVSEAARKRWRLSRAAPHRTARGRR